MTNKKVFCLFVFSSLLLFLFGNSVNAAQVQVPRPVGDIYVQDFANVLNTQQEEELKRLGRQIDDATTSQIAVLTVNTTGSMAMEEFANKSFRTYRLGSEKKNNGVLLVLAIKDRKIRIEVGYGLEGVLPDGKTGRILDENAIPYLQKGQPDLAVMNTYSRLAKEVSGEYKGTEAGQPPADKRGNSIQTWLIIIVIVGIVILDFTFFGGALSSALLAMFSRGGGGGSGGSGPRGGGGGSSGGG
jgi:uncharacterized protein